MADPEQTIASAAAASRGGVRFVPATNRVVRDTYLFLAITLVFSVSCAAVSLGLDLPHPSLLVTLAGYMGLLFLATKFRESAAGLGFVLALTGFVGYTLDPILSGYLALSGGPRIVVTALGCAAAVFISLSAFAWTAGLASRFSGALLVAVLGVIGSTLGSAALEITGPAAAVFATFVLLMSGLILYETSNIRRSRETNYIMATVTLFVAVLSLFTSSLHLVGSMDGAG
jgi:modulator of FtsH protease